MSLPYELVASTMYRQKKTRVVRLGFQFLTQAHDVRVHRSRGRELLVTPNFFQQAVACQGLSGMAEEILQKIELLRRNLERLAVARDLATAQVDFDIPECKLVFVL